MKQDGLPLCRSSDFFFQSSKDFGDQRDRVSRQMTIVSLFHGGKADPNLSTPRLSPGSVQIGRIRNWLWISTYKDQSTRTLASVFPPDFRATRAKGRCASRARGEVSRSWESWNIHMHWHISRAGEPPVRIRLHLAHRHLG